MRSSALVARLVPTSRAFKAIQSANATYVSSLTDAELRAVIPCLARTALCAPLDVSDEFRCFRREIQKLFSGLEAVNSIVSLLSVDFTAVQEDALKEQQIRKKLGTNVGPHGVLADTLQSGVVQEFERSEPSRRIRLVLSEVMRLCSLDTDEVKKEDEESSELFECAVYLEELSDVLAVAFAELPTLLPIRRLSEALLRVKYGPWILCRLIGNSPDCFEEVSSSLIDNSRSIDDGNQNTRRRILTLRLLCEMNPSYRLALRTEAVQKYKLPGLAIELSFLSSPGGTSGLVTFLTGLLFSNDSKTREWLSEYVKVTQRENTSTSTISTMRKILMEEMKRVTALLSGHEQSADTMDTDSPFCQNEDVIYGTAMLRLYCTLKGLVGFKVTSEESEALLDLIVCHPPPTAAGIRFAVVGLCTLVACSFVISEREEKATQWIEWLCSQQERFEKASKVHALFGEMLLLMAIHFHSFNLEAIVDLISVTIGVHLRPGSLTKMKILFTQQIFPEKVVGELALTVPVTPNLNKNVTGFLPVHCVHQLLKSRVFTKHCIKVNEWIFRQVCSATPPLHPLMIPLIEAFIHSIIVPIHSGKVVKQQKLVALEGFSEDEILRVFEEEEAVNALASKDTSWLLLMLYCLLYQDSILSNMKVLIGNQNGPKEYSSLLYTKIPMKQLFLKTTVHQASFGQLYPPLLRLLTKHYPHLCLVEDSLEEEKMELKNDDGYPELLGSNRVTTKLKCTPEELDSALQRADKCWSQAVIYLTRLAASSGDGLVQYIDVITERLPSLLHGRVPRKIQTLCCQIWKKLNSVVPRRLWLKTANALCTQQELPVSVRTQPYTEEELSKDPLIVLRCDRRVFRCPPIFDIMIRVLTAYLAASRALLSHHLQSHPPCSQGKASVVNPDLEREQEELKEALVAAQESSAIQILLEVCLPSEDERKFTTGSISLTLREIQCLVCSFLHQAFQLDPNKAKLVHFQGYPIELLEVTVAGVPSMHICLEFIPELLNQPQLDKQFFAIQLLSHLSLEYPMPKSMVMCKQVLHRLFALSVALPAGKRNDFFLPTLPALVRICKAFPPLREDATNLLLSLGKKAFSHWKKDSVFPGTALTTYRGNSEGDDEDDIGYDDGVDCSDIIHLNQPQVDADGNAKLCSAIEQTFLDITSSCLFDKLLVNERS